MKILIYGSRGWIATKIVDFIHKLYPDWQVIEGNARVENLSEVEEELVHSKAEYVLCCIGRTHGTGFSTIDYLEPQAHLRDRTWYADKGKIKENVRDNLFAPVALALLCKSRNILCCYIGTGCIYSYDELHPIGGQKGFTEYDPPNFFGSSYSIVKGYTNNLMRQLEDCVLHLRIRMPISSDTSPRNFISKITHYEKICSIPNSMTCLEILIPIALDMISKKYTGTFNFTNPGVISHNEILQMYNTFFPFCF